MSTEKLAFRAEVNQLLNLVINSLYSHKEIFLRELISNASDALDKARFESLTRPEILEGGGEWKIALAADKTLGTLTVSDNGIGMNREEIVRELGTIAHSGTLEYLKAMREKAASTDLIGQFGVGFYAAFMVADKVTVYSRRAGAPAGEAVRWESTADGTFSVEDVEKPGRGTDVILHLKDDAKQYLEEWEVRELVRKYSDFIEHPVTLAVEREEDSALEKDKKVKVLREETLNSRKALWLRDKSEIKPEEYHEFYRHLTRDVEDPVRVIHYRAEGTSEFAALLFLPARHPFDLFFREEKYGPTLYVKRVQIMPHCEELLPRWLRFVKGVVDSSDLPLNVSREILQNNRKVDVIHRNLTKKVLETLDDFKQNDYEKYVKFHEEFGRVLKEGAHLDYERREAVANLLLFRSTRTADGEYTTLADYVSRMKEDQKDIHYLVAENLEEARRSPHLEAFARKGEEVLLLTDEIDDIVFNHFVYKEKTFRPVNRGDAALDASAEAEREKAREKYAELLGFIRESLRELVKDVRLSARLTDSPCCLVGEEGGLDPATERMFRLMGRDVPPVRRIFEINPSHPVTAALDGMLKGEGDRERLAGYVRFLHDQALVVEGDRPKDPGALLRLAGDLVVKAAQ
ncbi:MAG: molecular chaperone HtpG [Acidobacteria bacterium]|nr:molecular chaperone HtpG [Acidobacteriota bacterium]